MENKDAFHSVLADMTNKNVYNLSACSTSPREILWLLRQIGKQNDYISQIVDNKNNIEYIIYVYINDHLNRLYYDLNEHAPHFLIQNGKIGKEQEHLYYRLLLTKNLQKLKCKSTSENEKYELFLNYLSEIYKLSEKNFSNQGKPAKFIILLYDNYMPSTVIDKIEALGIQVVKVPDFIYNQKYQISEDDIHPNKEAWQVIVPIIINKCFRNGTVSVSGK